jgi:hypothetical protein
MKKPKPKRMFSRGVMLTSPGGRLLFAIAALAGGHLYSQQATVTPVLVPSLPGSSYLNPALPSRVLGLATVHGNRFYTPGNERVTLAGTYTNSSGSSSAVLTIEIPGKVNLAIAGSAPKVLLSNGTQTSVSGTAAAGADQDILESLQSDGLEGFFFSFSASAGHLLGGHFRMDGGTSANYAGPYYDLWEVFQKVAVRPGTPLQQKVYYFDSNSGQFYKCRYKIQRGGKTVDVQTRYSQWAKTNGQLLPGRIERLEDGVSVFSFVAANAAVSTAANDGIFVNP